jgi:hypothetical protein
MRIAFMLFEMKGQTWNIKNKLNTRTCKFGCLKLNVCRQS